MAFSDDVRSLSARADAVRTDMGATVTQLATALSTRLRPLAALDWMTDDALQQACQAFAASAIRSFVQSPPL